MENPFPGVNPYLESPELWHQVHNRLIVAIADDLTPQIAPKYRVSIEERIYTTLDDLLLVGIADVAVTKRDSTSPGVQSTTAQVVQPNPVRVPFPQQVIERFLEVRSTQTNEIIAVLEILSPKNKRSKEGRAAYEKKRHKILGSLTHLVEIDLLRQGKPMSVWGATETDYRILVSRSDRRPNADLYAFNLKDPIPNFPISLRNGEPEPIVELQKLLNEVYARARFDLAIDYSQPVKPALPSETAVWVAEVSRISDR
ncbi:DUF4058 family protein [Lusitaniella coriacea LEGE 07157]|uniref:DUF4058 family protein n=1 Tax=Lusitaniella coriacea LEGE 07157 TaxID=945747 RepID=A0A8J7DSL7_9CYAN|nr:DUF4058 family protein [Lusitaniella coriacea]MBE9114337.1 DUF4058 family protein [Lusitaniella coriacea LEGE 07157]